MKYTIEQIEAYLNSIPNFGVSGDVAVDYNLQRMEELCKKMGNPEAQFPSIHVAGTNGKGTTCQMLASVYQKAGFKTGLYTSPHLIDMRERFRINGKEIDSSSLIAFFELYGDEIKRMGMTYFEITTAIAFWYFATQQVDITIIETGLGGRLDATNVVIPLASVITSIGLDHTRFLGDTLAQIAAEKAGIIKQGRPVVIGRMPEEARSVIAKTAEQQHAQLLDVDRCKPEMQSGRFYIRTEQGLLTLKASGRKKIDTINAGITFLVTHHLRKQFPVRKEQFVEGIEQVDELYGQHAHFQKLLPDKEWYFDGAHNMEAIYVLVEELLDRAPSENWMVILSMMKDKLTNDLYEVWKTFPHLYIWQGEGERAATVAEMKKVLPHAAEFDENDFLDGTDRNGFKSELVIFSGSFYFYKKVRRWMGLLNTCN